MSGNIELKRVVIVDNLGEDELDFCLNNGYLVDDRHAVYLSEGNISLVRVEQIAQLGYTALYLEDPDTCMVTLGSIGKRQEAAVIPQIIARLRDMTALSFLLTEVLGRMDGTFEFNMIRWLTFDEPKTDNDSNRPVLWRANALWGEFALIIVLRIKSASSVKLTEESLPDRFTELRQQFG